VTTHHQASSYEIAPQPAVFGPWPQPELDPASLPELYGLGFMGEYMSPDIKKGQTQIVDRLAPVSNGDLAVLYQRPEIVRPGYPQVIVVRVVVAPDPSLTFPHEDHPESAVQPVVIAALSNPPRQFMVPCANLLAMHRITSLVTHTV